MPPKGKSDGAPAPLSLRERNRLRTRQELLDAALEVFAEDGYGSATVEAIAARAGASKVTLYSYFPQGREELFRELYEQINNELIERVTEIYATDGHFGARILASTEALVNIAERPLIGRFYSIDDPALDSALNPVRGHASRVTADLIAKDLAAAQELRSLRTTAPPAAIAKLFVGAMTSALSEVAKERATSRDILHAMEALVSAL
ncbi:TetR/AcrR family transcriptional regulator [Nocardia sp. CA-084685]|uniref:TetR/AcrR family transcriptional regulator n=1 Tax=Nocardia sp. CA-084685 TaxID=3239970 RepID=UPI003D992ACA